MNLALADAAERAAFAEIGRLGEVEFDRVRCWVASGCEGAQPRLDVEARRVLDEQLRHALDAREAAERAIGRHDGADGSIAPSDGEIAATGPRYGAAA